MPTDTPPTIDPVAAARWQRAAPAHSPWLHEEVARRIFYHVTADRRALLERIASLDQTLDYFRSQRGARAPT